jgi:hypothetical protein
MAFEEKTRITLYILLILFAIFLLAVVLAYIDNNGILVPGKLKIYDVRYNRPLYNKGSYHIFNVYDFKKKRFEGVAAICRKVGRFSYVFAEKELDVPKKTVEYVSSNFDTYIYPTFDDALTGQLSKGVNDDNRVVILFLDKDRAFPLAIRDKLLKGFYTQTNERTRMFFAPSNESKVLYVFVNPLIDSDEDVVETVAHEANHLKNWSIIKTNIGFTFTSAFFIATLFLLYLGLTGLYYRFMSARDVGRRRVAHEDRDV